MYIVLVGALVQDMAYAVHQSSYMMCRKDLFCVVWALTSKTYRV